MIRTIKSGIRIAFGAILLPSARVRGKSVESAELISVDLFATLIQRCCDDDAAWRDGTLRAIETVRQLGLPVPANAFEFRREVEAELSAQMIAAGRDPEFSHSLVLEEMLKRIGVSERLSETASEIAAWELEREISFSYPIPETVASINEWSKRKRVVVVSDTRYSSTELRALLDRHQVNGIAEIYSSADFGSSKFSGRLFDEVTRRENVPKNKVLHIGDDLFTDALSPAQRGLAIRRVRKYRCSKELPTAPPRLESSDNTAFGFGYQTLGPILVAFTRLLFNAAKRDGIRHLAFVARDGELLLRVAQALAQTGDSPKLTYLEISRRAMACNSPDIRVLNGSGESVDRVSQTLSRIRALGSPIEQFQNYYGISSELVAKHRERLGIREGMDTDLRKLLLDSTFIAELHDSLRPNLIRRFLMEQGVFSTDCALVDVGWRGSLQALIENLGDEWQLEAPKGYYFGLWNEERGQFPIRSRGLVSDQRRSRTLLESSAWQIAFLLEATCRAKHGMVNGFRADSDGRIRATYIDAGRTREIERGSEQVQSRIQDGVIAYARWYSELMLPAPIDEPELRKEAQKRLYRLAFLPTADEVSVARSLFHSEPTSDSLAMPLVLTREPGIRGFIAGMRSPWKGGYVHSAGGELAARIYAAVEGLFCILPTGTKGMIRRALLRE